MSDCNDLTELTPDIVPRIWHRDYSLWPEPAPGDGGDWLGWLDLPDALQRGQGRASDSAKRNVGPDHTTIVLGMGGSSLTAAVLGDLFDPEHIVTLDTLEPATVQAAWQRHQLTPHHYIVASKSGTTVETSVLDQVFRAFESSACAKSTGTSREVASRFTAISDADTPLANRAALEEFRDHVPTPANVGGRFSALSAFGMYPADLQGLPADEMADHASRMRDNCLKPAEENAGYQLGVFLANHAAIGRDKVTIITSKSLGRLAMWVEQLLAESTGKAGRGLVPIVGEPILELDDYGDDRSFVIIQLASDPDPLPSGFRETLGELAHVIVMDDRSEVGAEFFRWQFAVAVAAAGIGVYPFNQPNVEAAKQSARRVLESDTQPELSVIPASDVIEHVSGVVVPGGYVALCAFLEERQQTTEALTRLRAAISTATGAATTFGYGPRYLHSTGQLHKGGPDSVVHAVFMETRGDRELPDITIPGTDGTMRDILESQAIGDVLAMRELGRESNLVDAVGLPLLSFPQE